MCVRVRVCVCMYMYICVTTRMRVYVYVVCVLCVVWLCWCGSFEWYLKMGQTGSDQFLEFQNWFVRFADEIVQTTQR